jgi:hypothetical protein
MAVPYFDVFVALLVVYLVYSVWARLDPRLPLAAALLLLVAAVGVFAANDVASANALAASAFCLLGGGVVLILIDHFRGSRRTAPADGDSSRGTVAEGPPGEPADEGDLPPEQLLDHVEEELVPPVDAPGHEDDPHEEEGDPDGDHGERPEGKVGVEDREQDPQGNAGDEQGHEDMGAERMDALQDGELEDR